MTANEITQMVSDIVSSVGTSASQIIGATNQNNSSVNNGVNTTPSTSQTSVNLNSLLKNPFVWLVGGIGLVLVLKR